MGQGEGAGRGGVQGRADGAQTAGREIAWFDTKKLLRGTLVNRTYGVDKNLYM